MDCLSNAMVHGIIDRLWRMKVLRYQSLCFHEKPDTSLCPSSDQLKTSGMDLKQHSYYLLLRCCHLLKSFPSESWNNLCPLDAALSGLGASCTESLSFSNDRSWLMPVPRFVSSFSQARASCFLLGNWTPNRQTKWRTGTVDWLNTV